MQIPAKDPRHLQRQHLKQFEMTDDIIYLDKIAVVVIATQKYINFVEPLIKSAKGRFLTGHQVDWYVLTDQENLPQLANCYKLPCEHYQWPEIMHRRYEMVLEHADSFRDYDYLYHMDVDLRFVAPVGRQICTELIATRAPGDKPMFCNDSSLQAFVPELLRGPYYTGSLIGGKTAKVLQLLKECAQWAILDGPNVCLEEQYLNRYYVENKPTLELSNDYCWPNRLPNHNAVIETMDKPKLDLLKIKREPIYNTNGIDIRPETQGPVRIDLP